jgi:hypothetical protein
MFQGLKPKQQQKILSQRSENPENGLPNKTLKIDGQGRAAIHKIRIQTSKDASLQTLRFALPAT